MTASELFPHDQPSKGLELLVRGLYGPHSHRWIPIRGVWRGTVAGRLHEPEASVNFSLHDLGWIAVPHDQEIETRYNPRLL